MHIKFADYPHLYSADYFYPKQKIIQKASIIEKITYWSGLFTFLLILPFTVVLILSLLMRRKWNFTRNLHTLKITAVSVAIQYLHKVSPLGGNKS